MRPSRVLCGLMVVLGLSWSNGAAAIDIAPGDYAALPSGVTLGMLYLQYSKANRLQVDGVGMVQQSALEVPVAIARTVHYNTIGGAPVSVQAFVPFGGFSEAKIGGVKQSTVGGLGDLTIGATVYPFHSADQDYGTTLGLSAFLTMPTGAFKRSAISLGSGTSSLTPQIGLIQNLGNNFVVDAALDVAFTRDFTDGGVRFERAPSTQLQTYLRYNLSPIASVSAGYSGHYGGKQTVNGRYSGLKTESHQVRVFANQFVTNTIQLQGMVGSDLSVRGGFKQGGVGQLRLLSVF